MNLPEGILLNSLCQLSASEWRADLRNEGEDWSRWTVINGIGSTAQEAIDAALTRLPHRKKLEADLRRCVAKISTSTVDLRAVLAELLPHRKIERRA